MTTRLLLALLLCGCTANDDVHPPSLGSLTPARGRPASTVMLNGTYFCAQPEPEGDEVDPLVCETMGVVTFEMTPASVIQYADQLIVVEVPRLPPGEVGVIVSVAGRRSNERTFTVE